MPLAAATCYWRVYLGARQLGHVSQRVDRRFGYVASHIGPDGRTRVLGFARTLREAAWWAMFGCQEVKRG